MSSKSAGRTILKNAAYITVGSVALKMINFLFRILVVRSFGDETFGQYSIVIAFVGLFQILAEPGITQYAMREIARDRGKARFYFWNLVALRLLLAAVGIVVITLAAILAGYSSYIVWGIALYALTFLLSAFEAPLEMLLIANERFDATTLLNIVGQLSFAVLGTIVLFAGYGMNVLVATGLVAMLPQIASAVQIVRRNRLLDFRPAVAPHIWPQLIRGGLPFAMISLSLIIAQSIDTVILSWFWPDEAVGWYNAAYRLAISLLFLFDGFRTAIVPTLSRSFVTDQAVVNRWYYRSVRAIALVALPMAVGGTLVARPLLTMLYGQEFEPAALIFQVIVWDVPLIMYASFCGNMTTIVNAERSAARIYAINAVANVVLNMIFIPRYGVVAAAAVTVVTDLLAAVQFQFLLSRRLHLPQIGGYLVRVALAAASMAVPVYLASGLHMLVQIGIGIITYLVALLLLHVPDAMDWAIFHRVLHYGRDRVGAIMHGRQAG